MRCASRTVQIAVALLLPCAVASAAPRVTIALLPQVQVSGDTVLLGQVAHLRSPDLALMRKLVDLPLGRAPQNGQQAIVRRGSLAPWIAREAGLQAAEIEWQNADAVHVQRARTVVAGGDILKQARAALHAKLVQEGGGSARIASSVLPRDVEVDAGEVTLQVKPIQGASLRNRMVVWVEVWAAGRFRRAIPVSLEIESSAHSAGTMGPLQYVPRAQALLGPAGEERRTDVARGDWAVLRTAAGAVTLESRVEVLQDGRVGDRVRVRQGGATGIVLARVTGPAVLEIAP